MAAKLAERLDGWRKTLTPVQMVLFGAAALTLLMGAFFLTRPEPAPPRVVLYSELAPADLAAVTSALDSSGVGYDISSDGTAVLVDRSAVHTARADLATQGVPTGGRVGFELLDDQGVTTNEFTQRVNYQRALSGELARTLEEIEGVDTATVHLVLPEDTAFANDDRQATASVLVAPEPGSQLGAAQVNAITSLVAASVPELAPSDVTVTDAAGRLLSAQGPGGAASLQVEQLASYEARLTTEVRRLIEPVVGAGNASVRVTAELNFDERRSTSETFDLDEGVERGPVLDERVRTETYEGSAPGQGGILGPDGAPLEDIADGPATNYESESIDANYGVDRTVEELVVAPGARERVDVAIVLDAQASTPEQAAAIEELAWAAVGGQPDNGDRVIVTRMDFGSPEDLTDEAERLAAEAEAKALADRNRATAILAGLVLVALGLAGLITWRRARRIDVVDLDEPIVLDDDLDEEEDEDDFEEDVEDEDIEVSDVELEGDEDDDTPSPEDQEAELAAEARKERLSRVEELVAARPDEVAATLSDLLRRSENDQ